MQKASKTFPDPNDRRTFLEDLKVTSKVDIREAAIEIENPIVNEALDRMIAAARSTNSGMPVDGFDGDINQSIAIEMLNHSLIAGSQQQRSAGERIRRPSHRLDV